MATGTLPNAKEIDTFIVMAPADGVAQVDEELEAEVALLNGHADAEVHLASVAERKRLWWRNALINGSAILAWYVTLLLYPCND